MKSAAPGPSTSPAEVTNVSRHGFWLFVGERELFVPFNKFPWFREASVREITNVQLPSPHHLYWLTWTSISPSTPSNTLRSIRSSVKSRLGVCRRRRYVAHRRRALSGAETATKENTVARTAIHPGEHLAEELDTLTMSAAELARRLKVPTKRVTEILNGQRAITGDTALRLAHFFGTSAEFWLNLQSVYKLRPAEAKTGKAIKKLPTQKGLKEAHA